MSSAPSRVQIRDVSPADDGLRLDRWFRAHFPTLKHGMLEKLLRKGQIRVDGGRAKAALRLTAGQRIRIPPLDLAPAPDAESRDRQQGLGAAEQALLRSLTQAVLYQDQDCAILNKPPGLAVQGGVGNERNLDRLLPALFPEKQARLVHRLDKDTSGALLIAFGRAAAARLTRLFKDRTTRKLYWALVVGAPQRRRGRIDFALAKRGRPGEEKMIAIDPATIPVPEDAKSAATLFATLDHAGKQASWLALQPLTGRTHQLRVHLAALGHPILGDGKYGGRDAIIAGLGHGKKMHLHARRLVIPREGRPAIDVSAPLPNHMADSFRDLGFDPAQPDDPFVTEDR